MGQLSLWDGHESDNGHGTAQNEKPGLAGLVRDFTSPLRPPMSRIYDPTARRSDYAGESEAAGFSSMRSVTAASIRDGKTARIHSINRLLATFSELYGIEFTVDNVKGLSVLKGRYGEKWEDTKKQKQQEVIIVANKDKVVERFREIEPKYGKMFERLAQ